VKGPSDEGSGALGFTNGIEFLNSKILLTSGEGLRS
jgi:hypothetical protein